MHGRIAFIGLTLGGLLSGCTSSQDGAAPAQELRARFPEQAALILDSDTPRARSIRSQDRRIDLQFPRDGTEAFRIGLPNGAPIEVREVGAFGEAEATGSAVAYARRGGTSFYTITEGGFEEWLLLESGIAFAGEPVAAWEVLGAELWQRGQLVELRDQESGAVRMAVTAPVAYAAGGREVPVRLSVTGSRISIEVDAAGEAVLVDPAWVLTESMAMTRSGHTATMLLTGEVLVAGGLSSNNFATSGIELYNPSSEGWMPHTLMNTPRYRHATALLEDGKVLVTGGATSFGGLGSASIYDPSTRKWNLAKPMNMARIDHTATTLQSGLVLVTGGTGELAQALSSTELYDPIANTWTFTGPMSVGRSYHTATLLKDGRVLLWGGPGTDVIPNQNVPFDLYDPATGTCASLIISEPTRQRHTATLLPDGKVLIAGGEINGTVLDTAQIFDPVMNVRTFVHKLESARAGHTATLLPYGKVLLAGGYLSNPNTIYLSATELYDAPSDTWSVGPALNVGRRNHTATLLPDTRVLVAGGAQTFSIDSAELYGTALGDPCGAVEDCPSGYCVDGVCCDSACDTGVCDACSMAEGASVSGTCELLTGTSCNDADECTKGDTCQAGLCVSGTPQACDPLDACHEAGMCDPATGTCSDVLKSDGAACEGGTCKAGECIPLPDAGGGGGGGAGGAGGAGGDAVGGAGGGSASFEGFIVQGGCWCSALGGPRGSAPWPLAAALLFLARARRRRVTVPGKETTRR